MLPYKHYILWSFLFNHFIQNSFHITTDRRYPGKIFVNVCMRSDMEGVRVLDKLNEFQCNGSTRSNLRVPKIFGHTPPTIGQYLTELLYIFHQLL